MIFEQLSIKGMYKIDLEKRGDDRGFFSRVFCQNEYRELGLFTKIAQANMTYTKDKLTFRGMHYQLPPKAEDKVMMCIKGAYYDVSIDLRPHSPTYKKVVGIELNEDNKTMLYIPKGCAHGYLILNDNTEILYLVSEYYAPDYERVIRWDDPEFNIELPFEPVHTSEKDRSAPDFDEKLHLEGMETLSI